ncbi:MAG: glycosyltransferase [Chloroflexota bacterium]
MDVSLVTSLYRSNAFLPRYIDQADRVARAVAAAGLTLELILVPNDATPTERDLIDDFVHQADTYTVRVLHVPRESVYASWNRGVEAATATVIGFWNVDDVRTADGIHEAHQRITNDGCPIVHLPWVDEYRLRWYGIPDKAYEVHREAVPFDAARFQRQPFGGPFFMFSPTTYQQVGPFDARFRVLGDFDWWVRAARMGMRFCPGTVTGGVFKRHGANLSRGTERGHLEENIIYLKHGHYDLLYPVNPSALRELWLQWADEAPPIPDTVYARWLGSAAEARWDAAAPRRRLRELLEPPKALARLFINHTGLRRPLYRLGLVKAPLP